MTIQELEQFIAEFGKDIYSFCYHLTNEKENADELYQDTFLEAMKKIKKIDYENNPKSYLLSISIGIWNNRRRKAAWRHKILPMISEQDCIEEVSENQIENEDLILKNECHNKLWQAIGKLKDNYRIPILLFYMEEQSIEEISKILSVPSGTVKSRLFNARKQLKAELEEYFL